MTSETSVAVVGAGITGLALARELSRLGVDHRVFEAEEEPGGVIRSRRVEGRVLELGPQRTRSVGPVTALVRDLGLQGEAIEAPPDLPLFVYRDGRLRKVPFSPGDAVATDLLSWRGKLRMLLEPLTGGPREGETVADFVTRKLGREAYEYLVGPLYGGIYGSDPRRMLVEHSLGRALEHVGVSPRSSLLVAGLGWLVGGREAPPALSFRDGMQTLTEAMYEEVRPRVRLGVPVSGLRRGDGGWVLGTGAGELAARRVVFTTPADETAGIVEAEAPGAASRLRRFTYNPLAVVHMHADCDVRGYGYQVALGEAFATRGVTWNDSLFGRDGVYTAYLGGAGRAELVASPDEEVASAACREFEEITGCAARPLLVSRTRMPAWDESWEAREGLRLPDGLRLCANFVDRAGIPGRLKAAREAAAELAEAA